MKKVLVINIGWEQEPLLKKLNQMDVEIFGIHYNKDYIKSVQYTDVMVCDLRDLNKILEFAKKTRPDAVISDECDYSHFAQAVVCENLKLRGPSVYNAQIASNKYLQRSLAKEKNLKIPTFLLCSNKDDVVAFANLHGFPLIIKPVDNRGSFGVNKISSELDIESAYEDAMVNSHSRLVIIEEFIEGMHITVDGYIYNGVPLSLAAASKIKYPQKDFIIDNEIVYPAVLDSNIYEKALHNAEEVARELGFTFGFTHGEFIIDKDNNIYLTEMANRGGGVYTSELIVPYVCENDILQNYIDDVLGIDLNVPKRIGSRSCMMKFFTISGKGTIKSIKGIKKIESLDNVLKLTFFKKAGDTLGALKSGVDRDGMIIISAQGNESLQANSHTALALLEVDFE